MNHFLFYRLHHARKTPQRSVMPHIREVCQEVGQDECQHLTVQCLKLSFLLFSFSQMLLSKDKELLHVERDTVFISTSCELKP